METLEFMPRRTVRSLLLCVPTLCLALGLALGLAIGYLLGAVR